MMAIIIGKNHVAYLRVRKKDLTKHFFKYRNQLYIVYPDELTPMETYHDNSWVESESVIVFAENVAVPLNCQHPARYEMDSRLASIDEHKLMSKRKKSFIFEGLSPSKIWDWIPIIILAGIGLTVLLRMVGI